MKSLAIIATSLAVASAAVLPARAPEPTVGPSAAEVMNREKRGASTGLSAEIDTTTSVNVGTLSPDALYTTISNVLESACPTPSGTVTACATGAVVTDIVWVTTEAMAPSCIHCASPGQFNKLETSGGELTFDFPFVQYSDPTARTAMISLIAATVANSTVSNTYRVYEDPNGSGGGTSWTFANAAGAVQAIYAVDSEAQNLEVIMDFKIYASGLFSCADGAVMADILSLTPLPGMQFLGPAISITCKALGD